MLIGMILVAVILPHKSVCAAASSSAVSGCMEIPIRAEASVEASYSVKTSPYLELVWNSRSRIYEGTYRVGVKGRIGNGQTVRVSPQESFLMVSDLGTQRGSVTQPVTRWRNRADSTDTMVISETVYAETTGTARAKLPGTAVYRGGITFTFALEQ